MISVERLKFLSKKAAKKVFTSSPAEYWTQHLVSNDAYESAAESLNHFHWRNSQYPGYIELMPVTGQDGKVILDYGCGPGNDVIGFSTYSKPKKMIAVDVSQSALDKAHARIKLHNKEAEFILLEENSNKIPLQSNSIDYIHSSGVLHHCANLPAVLQELHRILKDDGTLSIMIYNYDSLWMHLYVAWFQRLVENKYTDLDLKVAFSKFTDGESCPISHCYKPDEFVQLLKEYGFEGKFIGASMSNTEFDYMRSRFKALSDERLPLESKKFLQDLDFDSKGYPVYQGKVAGINACFRFNKIVS